MKRVGVDLDGTLVEEGPSFDRQYARPINPKLAAQLHRAVEAGCQVTVFTARPWGEYRMTVDQLARLGIPFNVLVMGKPSFDLFIDDRATSDPDALEKFLDREGL